LEDVVDPTGAGDTFAGGFIGYMAEIGVFDASAIRRAMVYGCAAASFCVEAFGIDRLRNLTRQEIDRRYGMFRALTFFEDASL
jgi:sugar/nucleoside kinase (ribokinase family)